MPINPADKLILIARILRDCQLSCLAKNVAAYLIECKNSKDGLCCPKADRLAADLGKSRHSICNAIAELRTAEYLVSRRRPRGLFYYFRGLPGDCDVQKTEHHNTRDVQKTEHHDVQETSHLDVQKTEHALNPGTYNPGTITQEKLSDPVVSDDASSPAVDPKLRLFRDGLADLHSLGVVNDKVARSLLGKWLRDTGGNAAHVADTIQATARSPPADPVPYLTTIFNRGTHERTRDHRTNSASRPAQTNADIVIAGMGRIASGIGSRKFTT